MSKGWDVSRVVVVAVSGFDDEDMVWCKFRYLLLYDGGWYDDDDGGGCDGGAVVDFDLTLLLLLL